MRKFALVACLVVTMCFAAPTMPANAAAPVKSGTGTLVIVFKDGHRQTFNLADIERVEFPAATAVAGGTAGSAGVTAPPRGHFLGKWECGDGNGNNFYITLQENGDALRSIGNEHGKWVYVNGEARVTWDDGAQDAIRKVGGKDQKFAYSSGKAFTDQPDNVTNARNTTPHPI